MTDEEHTKLNKIALEVYQGLLKEMDEGDIEEANILGVCYGYMLAVATIGYQPDQIGKDAIDAVDRLTEALKDE